MTTHEPMNIEPVRPAAVEWDHELLSENLRAQMISPEAREKLRARIRSIVDELAAENPVEWTPELLASTFTVPGPTGTPKESL